MRQHGTMVFTCLLVAALILGGCGSDDGGGGGGIDPLILLLLLQPSSPTRVSLSVASNPVAEDAGSVQGTVRLNADAEVDTTVTLASDTPGLAAVPASVIILAGTRTQTFTITLTDDGDTNGIRIVTLSAGATGLSGDTCPLGVTDDESPDSGPVGGVGIWNADGSPIPVYVLVSGQGPATPQADIYRDASLGIDPDGGGSTPPYGGEIFIMAKDPLTPGTDYQLGVTAYTGSGAGTEQFSSTLQFTASASGGYGQGGWLDELNAFRLASGVPVVAEHPGYTRAAWRHAGYLKLDGGSEPNPHEETDAGNQLYVALKFWDRIYAGIYNKMPTDRTFGGGAFPSGYDWGSDGTGTINVVHEGISGMGDREDAIAHLWNTVYHRIPMMRRRTTVAGGANSDDARTHEPGAGVPLGAAYFTMEYGGRSALAQTGSHWPPEGATNLVASFATDSESPDPIDAGNGGFQTPVTPDDNAVGGPIHIILPSTADLTGLTVTLQVEP